MKDDTSSALHVSCRTRLVLRHISLPYIDASVLHPLRLRSHSANLACVVRMSLTCLHLTCTLYGIYEKNNRQLYVYTPFWAIFDPSKCSMLYALVAVMASPVHNHGHSRTVTSILIDVPCPRSSATCISTVPKHIFSSSLTNLILRGSFVGEKIHQKSSSALLPGHQKNDRIVSTWETALLVHHATTTSVIFFYMYQNLCETKTLPLLATRHCA